MKIMIRNSFWRRGWLPVLLSIAIIWVSLIPVPFLRGIKFIPIDKIGHLMAFLVLAIFYLWAFDAAGIHIKFRKLKNQITFLITSSIGGLTELLQHYLPVNRMGDWFDFFFDIGGILIAIKIYPMIKQKILKRYGLLFFLLLSFQLNAQNAFQDAKAYQINLSEEYANPETSPLDSIDLIEFKALDFFPIDTLFRVKARLIRQNNRDFFEMQTTTDRKPEYKVWATAVFILKGKEYRLTIYQNKDLMNNLEYFDYLFLPFLDLTNGETTYGGGRYIDLRIPDNDMVIIDFNKAYNPYCAYNHHYSCPIVPKENYLDLAITAGVKRFN